MKGKKIDIQNYKSFEKQIFISLVGSGASLLLLLLLLHHLWKWELLILEQIYKSFILNKTR